MTIIGVDVGGTKCLGVAIEDGTVISTERRPTPRGAEQLVETVSSVVAALAGTRAIDFLRPTEAHDAILEAPRSGYTSDSSLVLGVGDIFITRIASAFCQFDFRQEIYAKFRVDSIIPAERRFKVQALINPNCGFRSFQTGIPEF